MMLKNNAQAKYGELVTVDQLTDSAEILVNAGYIEEAAGDVNTGTSGSDGPDLIAAAQVALDAAQAAFDNATKVASDAVADNADEATVSSANDAVAKAKMALTLAKGNLTKVTNAAKK